MSIVIDDEFLYTYVPQAEQAMLDRIPPEGELHHHFSRRFRRRMRALLRYERRTPKMRKFVHGCKVAFAALAIAASVTFGALMSVEASRTRIIEAITKIFADFTSVRISVDGGITDRVLRPVSPVYVPRGYEVKEEESNNMSHWIHYENDAGMVLDYTQDLLSAGENIFDTEDAYTGIVMIDGQEVQIILKESKNMCQVYWYDDLYFYWFDGELELKDEILEMAESIIAQKKFKKTLICLSQIHPFVRCIDIKRRKGGFYEETYGSVGFMRSVDICWKYRDICSRCGTRGNDGHFITHGLY